MKKANHLRNIPAILTTICMLIAMIPTAVIPTFATESSSQKYMVKALSPSGQYPNIEIPLNVTAGKTYTFSFKSTAQVMKTNGSNTAVYKNGRISGKFNDGSASTYNSSTGINSLTFTVPSDAGSTIWFGMTQDYSNGGTGIYMTDFKLVEEGQTENLFSFFNKLGGWAIGADYAGGSAVQASGTTSFQHSNLSIDLLDYNADIFGEADYMVKALSPSGQYPNIEIPLNVTAGKTYTFSFKSTAQVMKTNGSNTAVYKNGRISGKFNDGSASTYNSSTGINSLTFTVPSDAGSTIWFGMTQDYSNGGTGIYMTDFKLVEEGQTENLFSFFNKLGGWAIGADYAGGSGAQASGTTSFQHSNLSIDLLDYNADIFGEDEQELEQQMIKIFTEGGNKIFSACIPLPAQIGKNYRFSFKSTAPVVSSDLTICANGVWSKAINKNNGCTDPIYSYDTDTGITTISFKIPTSETLSNMGATWKNMVWVCLNQNYYNNGEGIYISDFELYEENNTTINLFDNTFKNKLQSWDIGATYSTGNSDRTKTTLSKTSDSGVTLTIDLLKYDSELFKTAPHAPTILSAENGTVTLEEIDEAEYSCDGGKTWQKSNIFSNLENDVAYQFVYKVSDNLESKVTRFGFPTDPVVLLQGATKLIIKNNKGFEYKVVDSQGNAYTISGGTLESDEAWSVEWFENSDFTGLKQNETYTIYKRCKNSSYENEPVTTVIAITDGADSLPAGSAEALVYVIKVILNNTLDYAADVNADRMINLLDLVRLKKNISGVYSYTVACWGDSITEGMHMNKATETYPKQLNNLLGGNYNVLNGGVGGEKAFTISARQGANALYAAKEIKFNSGENAIKIGSNGTDEGAEFDFVSADGKTIFEPMGLFGNEININEITIGGNTYRLRVNSQSYDTAGEFVWGGENTFYLTRENSDESVTIPAGTQVYLSGTNVSKLSNVNIYYAGTNDMMADYPYNNVEYWIEYIKEMTEYSNSSNYIVIIPHSSSKYDQVFTEAFGSHAVNLRVNAVENGLEYENITPTETDIKEIAKGKVPASLCYNNTAGDVHMNPYGYHFMAHVIYEKGKELNYWK